MSRRSGSTSWPIWHNAVAARPPKQPFPPATEMRLPRTESEAFPARLELAECWRSLSRQAAPGAAAQILEGHLSFVHRAARFKLPTGKILGSRRLAFRRHLSRTLDRTLDVGHVLKRLAKQLFLLDAMRTPVEP